jgi:hypothetical protein
MVKAIIVAVLVVVPCMTIILTVICILIINFVEGGQKYDEQEGSFWESNPGNGHPEEKCYTRREGKEADSGTELAEDIEDN